MRTLWSKVLTVEKRGLGKEGGPALDTQGIWGRKMNRILFIEVVVGVMGVLIMGIYFLNVRYSLLIFKSYYPRKHRPWVVCPRDILASDGFLFVTRSGYILYRVQWTDVLWMKNVRAYALMKVNIYKDLCFWGNLRNAEAEKLPKPWGGEIHILN